MVTKNSEPDYLNEEGQQVLELKKVLLESKDNSLIFNMLLKSLSEESFDAVIYQSLIEADVDLRSFENLLMANSNYVDLKALKTRYKNLQTKVSSGLERKNVKYFTTRIPSKKVGVEVVRKFGIGLNYIQREFRLTEKKAQDIKDSGFVKTYAQLTLDALMKDILEKAKKEVEIPSTVTLEVNALYEATEISGYNMDFIIFIHGNEYLNANTPQLSGLYGIIEKVLKIANKEYQRKLSVI